MKTLALVISLMISGPTNGQDSLANNDMSWLEAELTLNQELPDCSFLPCAKNFYVDVEGEVILEADQVAVENNLLDKEKLEITRRSDLLFESHTGDKYFLIN